MSQFLDDWDTLVWVAHYEKVGRTIKQKGIWELLERVVPIQGRNKRDDEWTIIRVLRNRVEDRLYLDVRIFRKIAEEINGVKTEKFKRTSKGTLFPLKEWKRHLSTIVKLVRKYE